MFEVELLGQQVLDHGDIGARVVKHESPICPEPAMYVEVLNQEHSVHFRSELQSLALANCDVFYCSRL